MKYLKGKWKRTKTQNKIPIQFSKILKTILNFKLSQKTMLLTKITKNHTIKNIIALFNCLLGFRYE